LKTDHSNPEHGMDLVGELDYLSDILPTLNVFTERRWLTLKHLNEKGRLHISFYYSQGFHKVKSRITVLGNIPIVDTDPKDCSTFCGWYLLGRYVQLQREWEAEQNV
jgi:hypothetical protein